jgi:hypothetical protein
MRVNPTVDTPEVIYDDSLRKLSIRGRSLPEDAWSFYEPVIGWAKSFIANGESKLTVEFFLEYFNSSSGRYLLELLSTFEAAGKDVRVLWLTEPEDELMQEKGEEFSGLVDLPFDIRQAQ